MKKPLFIVAFIIVISAVTTYAQDKSFTTIIPSSAPAFTILGISPTEISKPNSWNALQGALYQNFNSNNQGTIPKNFALEFSPYWLSDHPNFTFKDYLDKSGFSLRNLNISLATGTVQYGRDSVQGLGFGIRIPIWTAKSTTLQDSLTKTIKENQKLRTAGRIVIVSLMNSRSKTVGDFFKNIQDSLQNSEQGSVWKNNKDLINRIYTDTLGNSFDTTDSLAKQKINIRNCIATYTQNHQKEFTEKSKQAIVAALKEIAQLEVSGALGMVFPTDQFNNSRISKIGVWSDYSFSLDKQKNKLDATVALRYVRDFKIDSIYAANNVDVIGRLNFYTDSQQKFTLSAWGLLRFISASSQSVVINNLTYYHNNTAWDNKYGVDISYKVSDNVAFAYSFGKGYSDPFSLTTLKSKLVNFLTVYYSIDNKALKASGQQYLNRSL